MFIHDKCMWDVSMCVLYVSMCIWGSETECLLTREGIHSKCILCGNVFGLG